MMLETRTDRDGWFLDLAERCARQGTCLRRLYGAVVVDSEGTVISTGYCGAPRKADDCVKLGKCWRQDNNIQPGTHYEKCRSVHAEVNALLQAGKAARKSTLYLVGLDAKTGLCIDAHPCSMCSRVILNAQIDRVVMRRSKNAVVHITPKRLNELWDMEVFHDKRVDWQLLRLTSE